MGNKIFISYKYDDSTVFPLKTGYFEILYPTTVRDYVDKMQTLFDKNDHINKGEDDGEDLSNFSEDTIVSKLSDRMFDSSLTIVIISPQMREFAKSERQQWIPWEISYSLQEKTREDKTSKSNALLAVVLPDKSGSYQYFIKYNNCTSGCFCRSLSTNILFKIMQDNMFNQKNKQIFRQECPNVYTGYSSYIHYVVWEDFILDCNKYIGIAYKINDNIIKRFNYSFRYNKNRLHYCYKFFHKIAPSFIK